VKLLYVNAEDEDEEDVLLYEDACRIFSTREIRLRRHYNAMIVAVDGEDVVGAAAIAPDLGDDSLEFSIAIHPRHERRGIARLLTKAVLGWARRFVLPSSDGEVVVQGEVVNQVAIPPLLASLSFANVRLNLWEIVIR
jgi:GNAT superfamily N-acetyltransferase